jgi:hypothetical protein
MARPERKNVDYFPHYMNHGSKMKYLEKKYGNDGYAVWYKIMERLGSSENHFIDLKDEMQLMFLADFCNVSEEVLLEIIEVLVRVKWIHKKLWNCKVLHSVEFLQSVKDAYKRRQNECINTQEIELMYYNNQQENELMHYTNTQSKVKETKLNKTILERKADFKKSLHPFLEEFGKDILNEFFSYWSEHGERDRKMRFEKEKSFGINRRLATWLKNQKRFEKEKSSAKKEKPKMLTEQLKQDYGIE